MRAARAGKEIRPVVVAALMTAAVVMPLVGTSVAGAESSHSNASDVRVLARATLHCGAVTFIFSPTNPVTYFQINAVGVSCAVAKNVLVKAGKYHGVPPAGWTYVGSGTQGAANCFISWKHGSARVVAYRVNGGAGC